MIKLSLEKQELLDELLGYEGYKLLVGEVGTQLLEPFKANVLNKITTNQDDAFELAILKAKYEGAQRMLATLADLKKNKKLR